MILQMNRPWYARLARDYSNGRLRICILILTVLALAGCRHQPVRSASQPFTFVQMCDPQVGFTDYTGDLARFEQAIKQINALHPDLVVICGDLVNAPNRRSFTDFNAAKAHFTMPSHVAPGNHDVGNKPDLESLKRYRRFVGKDFYSFNHKGCTFLVLNSQLWKSPVAQESEKQDAWLVRTLRSAARKRRPVFIVMHYPPFVKDANEPDEYFNLPREKRTELLSLFQRSGVVAVLAGHTHTTTVHEYHGIQIVTSETTSRNFDSHPFGFRLWHVEATRPYRNEFVPLN